MNRMTVAEAGAGSAMTRRTLLTTGAAAAGALVLPAVPAAAHASNPADLTLLDAVSLLRSRKLSARELVSACIDRFERLDPVIRAFITRTDEQALAAARSADRRYAERRPLPLDGVPVGLKDLYYTSGTLTTAASRALGDFVPEFDATVWARLAAAGAGLFGKLNMDEFAVLTGSPPTGNPWDPDRSPAGSSGGSGAVLGARFMPAATGSDTGGSIRLPASVCGAVGLKPTYGLVSRHGTVALRWSNDHAGPMARTVADVAYLLSLIQGPDPRAPTTLPQAPGDYPLEPPKDLNGVRIGVPTSHFWEDLDPSVERTCRQAVRQLAELGATVVDVPLPASFEPVWEQLLLDDPVRLRAGGGSSRSAETSAYHRRLKADRGHLYSPHILALVNLGETVPAPDYLGHLQLRSVFVRDMRALFRDHALDVIAHPTAPDKPPPRGSYMSTRLTGPWNETGFPSLSLPVGLDDDGLPVGLCLNSPPLTEARLFSISLALEQAIGFTDHRPGILR